MGYTLMDKSMEDRAEMDSEILDDIRAYLRDGTPLSEIVVVTDDDDDWGGLGAMTRVEAQKVAADWHCVGYDAEGKEIEITADVVVDEELESAECWLKRTGNSIS